VGDALIHISSRHFHKTASVVIHLPSPSCVLQRPAQIIDFSVKELTKKTQKKINGTCKSTRASRSGVTTKPIAEKSSSAVSWLDAVSVATDFRREMIATTVKHCKTL